MEIKEKAKKFVKNNWRTVVIGGGIAVVGITGFVLGRKFTFGEIENYLKIDLTRDVCYSAKDCILKDFWGEDALSEALLNCGFNSLDDEVKVAALIQKK